MAKIFREWDKNTYEWSAFHTLFTAKKVTFTYSIEAKGLTGVTRATLYTKERKIVVIVWRHMTRFARAFAICTCDGSWIAKLKSKSESQFRFEILLCVCPSVLETAIIQRSWLSIVT